MDENKLRRMAKQRAEFKKHVSTYVIVIGVLALINLFVSRDSFWVIWPALGWGIALVFQGYNVYGGSKETLEEKEYQKLKEKYKKD